MRIMSVNNQTQNQKVNFGAYSSKNFAAVAEKAERIGKELTEARDFGFPKLFLDPDELKIAQGLDKLDKTGGDVRDYLRGLSNNSEIL